MSPGATTATRTAAVKTTAASSGNACNAIRPFYWEIGNGTGVPASDSTDARRQPCLHRDHVDGGGIGVEVE